MDTLYSTFAMSRFAYRLALCGGRAERRTSIKRMFCDVFGHFHRSTVAKRRHSVVALALTTTAFLCGCAGVGGLSADDSAEKKSDAVAARAKARWEALINLDVSGAYAYLSPASRATMPLDMYKAKHKIGMYRAVKVDDARCQAESCTVKLSLTYDYKRFKGVTTALTEKWIISEGQAWFVDNE